MHTTSWYGEEKTVVFNHHGDYSGNVDVRVIYATQEEIRDYELLPPGPNGPSDPPRTEDLDSLPFEAMLHLVASMIRSHAIAMFEDMDDYEILSRAFR
jgi:hypothetical protein